jgi:oligopeptidase B
MISLTRRHLLASAACATALALPTATFAAGTSRTMSARPEPMRPPVAAAKPFSFTRHGITVQDPYAWLRDKDYPKVDDPEILAYLNAENAYFEHIMAPHQATTDTLFKELRGRLKEDDSSVPSKNGDFLYWWAFKKGAQYRTWYRKPVAGGADAVLLDEPIEAQGKEYFRLGGLAVSPDATLLAWSSDTNGSERYTVRVRELATGKDREVAIPETRGEAVWAEDGSGFFYTLSDKNWRPYLVKFHRLGSDPATDVAIYEEKDPGFFLGVGKTQSKSHIAIVCGTQVTSEVRLIPAKAPLTPPVVVRPRQENLSYSVDEREGTLYIRANDTHVNFRIATAPVDKPDQWSELIPGSDRIYIMGLTSFKNALVISERVDGLDQIRIRDYAGAEHRIAFPEASYAAGLGSNADYEVSQLRVGYESMVTPDTVYDYDLASRTLITRKVQEIPSGYDASQYVTERLMAPARDGVMVPISIVYKKGFPRDGLGRVHLYGYGSYGIAMSPSFSSARLSLLDRGFAYAIAHVRGGDDMGYQWYLDGKLDKRVNTFNDFVDCANFLIAQNYARRGTISASGGSAGGWLMGAVMEQDPGLWRAIVAHVPFVDVVNTILDETLPLTPPEWPEWGNPITDPVAFKRLLALSPYDQVKPRPYPPILITGGLNDPRVTYWEPAKWAARLRATKTDSNVLLLKTNMGAGHGGKSGRFERLTEVAEEYTFLMRAFGMLQG